ncbi:polysaccharide biosynthesis tyrosine autokinase [Arthrobacter sp. Sa2CUA1]|uniref:Polysaccharide biosynthesis tyrosine autokinase n=1 Tax=Arthrobacter gallicola TaxID=2762225 RepID=A0ABR8UU20_9MICC|nr:polysaccharide biosynthesis tyrosine autokinase [Arthrobacter gallicola]MBD7996071.1 polysaccharide biosynthesis tyrosine autokinase [Arthrobacter gallicola]
MDLRDYRRILRRYWVGVLACTLAGLVVAGAGSLLLRPTYTAYTQLFVAIQSTGSVAELQQGNSFTQARVQSYVQAAKTPAVLQPVIDSLALDLTPAQLATQVAARADMSTVLITISVADSSPVQAASVAEAVSASLIALVGELESPASGGSSPVKLSVVTPAVAPATPSSPNIRLNLAIGLLGGLVAGVCLALLRSAMDTYVRGEQDLRLVTEAPLLGGISFDADAAKKPLLTQASPQSPRAESFRQIRTNLQFASVNNKSKTVLVTSSLPSEGKSTTATNLAIALSQAGQRVVLVDADLRRPMVANYLGLESSAGLTTALVGTSHVQDLLQPWGEGELYVLTSGQIPPNPSELLGSPAMSGVISRLEELFDAVIIDAPPLLPVTDATVLAQKAGGVILVAGMNKLRSQDLEKALSSLSLVEAKLLGVVLNLLPTKGPDAYSYTYYSHETAPAGRKQRAQSSRTMNASHVKGVRRSRSSSNIQDYVG